MTTRGEARRRLHRLSPSPARSSMPRSRSAVPRVRRGSTDARLEATGGVARGRRRQAGWPGRRRGPGPPPHRVVARRLRGDRPGGRPRRHGPRRRDSTLARRVRHAAASLAPRRVRGHAAAAQRVRRRRPGPPRRRDGPRARSTRSTSTRGPRAAGSGAPSWTPACAGWRPAASARRSCGSSRRTRRRAASTSGWAGRRTARPSRSRSAVLPPIEVRYRRRVG